MAEIKEVTEVVASALSEISLAGTVAVKMDGEEKTVVVDAPADEAVEVMVIVKRIDPPFDETS